MCLSSTVEDAHLKEVVYHQGVLIRILGWRGGQAVGKVEDAHLKEVV
jgi:hypothetical protein